MNDSNDLITNPTIVAAIIGAVGTIIAALINRSKSENAQASPPESRQKRGSRFIENGIVLVVILVVLGLYGERGLYILGGLLGGALFAIIAWHLMTRGR